MRKLNLAPLALILPVALSGCGVKVPEKDFFALDRSDPRRQGNAENALVAHVKCEIKKGLYRVEQDKTLLNRVPWLYTMFHKKVPVIDPKTGLQTVDPQTKKPKFNDEQSGWGTAVNLTMQVDEQSSLNPGVALTEPFHNAYNIAAGPSSLPLTPQALAQPSIASVSQNWGLGIGVSASMHSTRAETIQFAYANSILLKSAHKEFDPTPSAQACNDAMNGVLIESDLKIADFIYDKAVIASAGNDASVNPTWAPFGTFQDQITFTTAFSGGVTPTWKFARASVNPSSPLVGATRNEVNTLIITLGPLDLSTPPSPTSPLQLRGGAAAQHQAAQIGVATSGSTSAGH